VRAVRREHSNKNGSHTMMSQSFRSVVAGLIAISSSALCSAAPAGAEQPAEHAALPEHVLTAMEEVRSVGALLTPYMDMKQLEAQLREQALRSAEQLNAAIENELREMMAPRFDIEVAGTGSRVEDGLPAAG